MLPATCLFGTQELKWRHGWCPTVKQGKLDSVVNILKRYISVDVYWLCAEHVCKPKRSHRCFDLLMKDYYFYLSYSNYFCVNYVIEKVHAAMMQADITHVVFGGANYTRLLPQRTFADVSTLSSIQDLSVHLEKVTSDRV